MYDYVMVRKMLTSCVLQLAGRRVPLELKLLHSVQNIEGVIKLLDFYERPDSFIYVMERPATSKVELLSFHSDTFGLLLQHSF